MATSPTSPNNTAGDTSFYADLDKSLQSIASKLQKFMKNEKLVGIEAKNTRDVYYETKKVYEKLLKYGNEYLTGRLKTKTIEKDIAAIQATQDKLSARKKNIEKQISDATLAGDLVLAQSIEAKNKLYTKSIALSLTQTDIYKTQLEIIRDDNELIDKKIGLVGVLLKGLKSLPFIGKILKIDEAIIKMREMAIDGVGSIKIALAGLQEAFSEVSQQFTLALMFEQAVKLGLQADNQVTSLSKSLMFTKDVGDDVRETFVNMSLASNDVFITTTKLVEANLKLSEVLGISKDYSKDILTQFIAITQKIGVSEESAAGLVKLSVINGKTLKQNKNEVLGMAQAMSSAYGVQLDNKEILEEVGKVTGQILANFQGNPEALAHAVALTKAMGTNLETVRKQSESLLNFESSIESELKAELLLGQTLNYERARAAALQGDLVTAMKELNNQGITWNGFNKMNVIQQQALAESMGLSSDELSNQLMKQQFIGKSRAEILALGGEEVAQSMEQLSAQDKFNAAIDKLKDLVGNLVAGPMGQLLDALANFLTHTTMIKTLFVGIAAVIGGKMLLSIAQSISKMIILVGLSKAKAVADLASMSALTLGVGIVAAIGAAAAGAYALNSMMKADDMVMPGYGKRTITGPEGAIALNDKDTVIAGTDLFPKGGQNSQMGNVTQAASNIDISPLVQAIKEVKNEISKLNAKEGAVYLDSQKVGTILVQGSYKMA